MSTRKFLSVTNAEIYRFQECNFVNKIYIEEKLRFKHLSAI